MGFRTVNNTNDVAINVANTNLNGTGAISTLFTAGLAGSLGSMLQTIRIDSRSAVPVGMVRIFIDNSVGVGPTNWSLLKEIMIPNTPLNNPPYPAFSTSVDFNLPLKGGFLIGVSTHTATNFNVTAIGYDITGFI